jgi:hypothetical protein
LNKFNIKDRRKSKKKKRIQRTKESSRAKKIRENITKVNKVRKRKWHGNNIRVEERLLQCTLQELEINRKTKI